MRRSSFLAACIVVGALLGATPSGATDIDFFVQAGAVHPTQPGGPYEFTNYYPNELRVHRGQTIRFTISEGFHTVTFSRIGRPRLYRADDLADTYAAPESWTFGSACGRTGQAPCTLDAATDFLSTGVPLFDEPLMDVTVDLPVGDHEYFCTVHPSMRGVVEVVPDAQATGAVAGDGSLVQGAAGIQGLVTQQIADDGAAALALLQARQTPVSTIEDGQRVWRVLLGDSTADNHVSLLSFLPSALQIEAGDKIRYEFRPGIIDEVHTATFPGEASGAFAPVPHGLAGFGFYPSCDVDDPATGLKGIPGAWGLVGPPCLGHLELAVAPWMTTRSAAPGNMVLTPATYHDSATLVPPGAGSGFTTLPDTGRVLPDTFEAEFPAPGSFQYECNVHADPMTGSVTVS